MKQWSTSRKFISAALALIVVPFWLAYFQAGATEWLEQNPSFVWVGGGLTLALLLMLSGLGSRAASIDATNEFALIKPVLNLVPEDLGFKSMQPGDPDPIAGRPFYEVYIPRTAVPYEDHKAGVFTTGIDEKAIGAKLAQGHGVLFVGSPLQGKTRTAYQILKSLGHFTVVRVRPDQALSDQACALVSGKRVICLLDDLHNQVNPEQVLTSLGKLEVRADQLTIFGTTRDGSELSSIFKGVGKTEALYETVPNRYVLKSMDEMEKSRLADSVQAPQQPYASPGEICMRHGIDAFLNRFEQKIDPPARDTFRSAQFLKHWGVDELTRSRLRIASAFVRDADLGELSPAELAIGLNELADTSFLLSTSSAQSIEFEEAYTSGPHAERFFGSILSDSIIHTTELVEQFLTSHDEDGALSVASGLYFAKQYLPAETLFEIIARDGQITTVVAKAIFAQGHISGQHLNQPQAAVDTYDALIEQFASSTHPP